MKSSGTAFVKENTGNIKDFYKISSCIGRGKLFGHGTLLTIITFYKIVAIWIHDLEGFLNELIDLIFFIGAYGEVRKCLHKETKALRAVKIIGKKYL